MGIDKGKILDSAQKYIRKGESQKAVQAYVQLVEADPQDKRLHLKLGDLYIKNGEEEKGIQEYKKVGTLYEEEDLNPKAIAIYRKILSIDPKHTEAYHVLARLYIKEGLGGNAKNCYQSILKINPRDAEALKALKNISEKPPAPREGLSFPSGDTESITETATETTIVSATESALTIRPSEKKSSPGASLPIDIDSLLQTTEKRSPERDKDSETHYNLGIAYKEMGLYDLAITEFESASSNPSVKFDSYIMLGDCYMEKGDYNKSIEYYKTASKIQGLSDKKLAWLQFSLGQAYEANGMLSEAIATFNIVLNLDHSHPEAKEKLKKLQSQKQK